MSEPRRLVFQRSDGVETVLPHSCTVAASCYVSLEIRQMVAFALQGTLQSLAGSGMDLRALDGVTLTEDCSASAAQLHTVPEGHGPLGMEEQPDTLEMARTVPVWRGKELRFHIVLRAGLAIGMLGMDRDLRSTAYACIAHEAAHVEHEGHLFRTFPDIYGRQVPCGDRSRKTYLKAMDVWSEYAACRSSAMFHPETLKEFEKVFCRAVEESFSVCRQRLVAAESDSNASQVSVDIERLLGDVSISAGYFLGHLDGLGVDMQADAPRAWALLAQHAEIGGLIRRLRRTLNGLWLNEYKWTSIEVFTPIYEVIRALIAVYGFVLTKADTEWRVVRCAEHKNGDH